MPPQTDLASPELPTASARREPSAAGVNEGFHIAEDVFEVCPCGEVIGGDGMSIRGQDVYTPSRKCFWCNGSGYRLTKRIVRPAPQPNFDEQAARQQLQQAHDHIRKCAGTMVDLAERVRAGKKLDPRALDAAAQAIIEPVKGQE